MLWEFWYHQLDDLGCSSPPSQSGSALPSPDTLFQKYCAFHLTTEWVRGWGRTDCHWCPAPRWPSLEYRHLPGTETEWEIINVLTINYHTDIYRDHWTQFIQLWTKEMFQKHQKPLQIIGIHELYWTFESKNEASMCEHVHTNTRLRHQYWHTQMIWGICCRPCLYKPIKPFHLHIYSSVVLLRALPVNFSSGCSSSSNCLPKMEAPPRPVWKTNITSVAKCDLSYFELGMSWSHNHL